jgi:hypothetical protein
VAVSGRDRIQDEHEDKRIGVGLIGTGMRLPAPEGARRSRVQLRELTVGRVLRDRVHKLGPNI